MEIADTFREQVRIQPKASMPDATKQALVAHTLHSKVGRIAEEHFVAWLGEQDVTVGFIMDLIYLLSPVKRGKVDGDVDSIRRRALKCCHYLQKGYKVYRPYDINFYAELLPQDVKYSDSQFAKKYPIDYDQPIYTAPAEAAIVVPTCALGRRCMRAKSGKAAPTKGRSLYCSSPCRGRAKVQKATTQV